MALTQLSDPQAVVKAIAEYDAIGVTRFCAKYGFERSRKYWLVYPAGKFGRYISKAILGAAHGYQFPDLGALGPKDLSGGDETIRKLKALGFDVAVAENDPSNPDWFRDEIILALDLYFKSGNRSPGKHSSAIADLSSLMLAMHRKLGTVETATLRNANGVSMKLSNFQRLDPAVRARGGKGLPGGNKLEADVWREFSGNLPRLSRVAAAIRAAILQDQGSIESGAEPYDDEEAPEGRVLTRLHQARERNRALVIKKKAQAMARHGRLACEVCSFVFLDRYGARGADFIECHHTRPVEALGEDGKTKLSDLALLCANCHRMIHARRPWLHIDELRAAIALV